MAVRREFNYSRLIDNVNDARERPTERTVGIGHMRCDSNDWTLVIASRRLVLSVILTRTH